MYPLMDIIDSNLSSSLKTFGRLTIRNLLIDDDNCILETSKLFFELTEAYEVETVSSVGRFLRRFSFVDKRLNKLIPKRDIEGIVFQLESESNFLSFNEAIHN
jgi:hypothetical protein